MIKPKRKSIAQQINELTDPTPKFQDPEDDINEESSARNILRNLDDSSDEGDSIEYGASSLRRKVAPTLSDIDKK